MSDCSFNVGLYIGCSFELGFRFFFSEGFNVVLALAKQRSSEFGSIDFSTRHCFMMLRWIVCSLLVLMVMTKAHGALAGDKPIIVTDGDGNLFINTSSTSGNTRVFINGVDVLGKLTELREILVDQGFTAAPTNTPVTYSGTVGCQLSNMPSHVTHIVGDVNLVSCTLLTALDLQLFDKLVQVSGYFRIVRNDALINVDGLGKLTSIGDDVIIKDNNALANVDGLRSLTSVGGHLRLRDNAGLTNVDALGSLLSVGSYVRLKHDIAPLHTACRNDHVKVVEMLLKRGVDAKSESNNDTPLQIASVHGHVEMVEMLLKLSVDAEAKKNSGWTPLHTACYYGRVKVVEMLMEHGVDAKAKDNDGQTPLHSVCKAFSPSQKAVQQLLRHGADPDARDLVSQSLRCRTLFAFLLHLRLIPDDLLWQAGARPLDLLLSKSRIELEVGLFFISVLIAETSSLTDEFVLLYSWWQSCWAQPNCFAPTKLRIPMVRT
ncbi:uncharacterized protein MONBRDRAFT_7571 [Monosiga brevicollis MX1]|uniref:Uncharacterized protein n=1 Tax=Monosiga brevicollis TaxID=81824 RepID=A9UXE5_MONBE|nr:uncharacterized protein MONBRDRAFT_7571 [Monosiga brevicollis MX1]EDQ90202.1 predicted protein [Monosiga brevicollis MX1]|eukprot:XP_001744969.1 hypothetical protein [Monosiga brevicollis MX1]